MNLKTDLLSLFTNVCEENSTPLKVTPEIILYINNTEWENKKELIKTECQKIPTEDLISWNLLRRHTDQNELLAKILIAIGDKLQVWKRFPEIGMVWNLPHFPCAYPLNGATCRSGSNNLTRD